MNTMDKRVERLEKTTQTATPRITEIVRAFYRPGPQGPIFVGEIRRPIAPTKPREGDRT